MQAHTDLANISSLCDRILARALEVVNVEQVAIILLIHLSSSSSLFQLFIFLPEGKVLGL